MTLTRSMAASSAASPAASPTAFVDLLGPRGRPRGAQGAETSGALRSRSWYLRKKLRADGVQEAEIERLVVGGCRTGRPRKSYDELTDEGKKSRRRRASENATRSEMPVVSAQGLLVLLDAAAAMAEDAGMNEEAAAAAEAEAATAAKMMKQRRQHERLQREMALDRGFCNEVAQLVVNPLDTDDMRHLLGREARQPRRAANSPCTKPVRRVGTHSLTLW